MSRVPLVLLLACAAPAAAAWVPCTDPGITAPVPLERAAVCAYCGAPVMLLDPDAVSKALKDLTSAEAQRTEDKPLTGDAIIAIANVERELARSRRELDGDAGVDLVALGLRAMGALLTR